MCYYPRYVDNPKYKDGLVDTLDRRKKKIPVNCGQCKSCRKRHCSDWTVRLTEEMKSDQRGQFVTLTFSNESLKELAYVNRKMGVYSKGYDLDNWICKLAVRRFLERWRKKHGKSVKHWFITELGKTNTERVHLHGIIWTDKNLAVELPDRWNYGIADIGSYCNTKSIGYLTKYLWKPDEKHEGYFSKIMTSPGIGRSYGNEINRNLHWQNGEFRGYWVNDKGYKLALPRYLRLKLTTEKERQRLWTEALNKNVKFLDGKEYNMNTFKGVNEYFNALKEAQLKSERQGYIVDLENKDREQKRRERNALRELKHKEYIFTNLNTNKDEQITRSEKLKAIRNEIRMLYSRRAGPPI